MMSYSHHGSSVGSLHSKSPTASVSPQPHGASQEHGDSLFVHLYTLARVVTHDHRPARQSAEVQSHLVDVVDVGETVSISNGGEALRPVHDNVPSTSRYKTIPYKTVQFIVNSLSPFNFDASLTFSLPISLNVCFVRTNSSRERERENVLFNDALNTFLSTVIWRQTYG